LGGGSGGGGYWSSEDYKKQRYEICFSVLESVVSCQKMTTAPWALREFYFYEYEFCFCPKIDHSEIYISDHLSKTWPNQ